MTRTRLMKQRWTQALSVRIAGWGGWVGLVGLVWLVSLLVGVGCGDPVRVVQLQLMCQPKIAQPNAVSFIFKAQMALTAQPVTDLLSTNASVVDNAPNYENIQFVLQHPEKLSLRTLILLDASGSLWTPDGSLEQKIKTTVIKFVDQIYQADQRNMIGVYMFRGADDPNLLDLYPFSATRDQVLSDASYANLPVAQQEQMLQDAWTKDRLALEQAIMNNYVTQRYATTGLFDATLRALTTLQQPSSLPTAITPLLSARTLILFTDGNDEVYTGAGMAAKRTMVESQVLQQASAFRAAGDNTILVAGVTGGAQAPGDQLDLTFLGQLASPNGVLQGDLSKLPDVFGGVAQQAVAGVQKYYQFNMCSPRRKTPVEAQLRLAYPDGTATVLTFNYDATSFRDPTDAMPCNVKELQSCDITGN